jgi:hypothetical protein
MSTEIPESDIRIQAYELWLAAGSPEGQDDDFWHEARARLKNPSENRETGMGDEVAEGTFNDKNPKVIPAKTK